MRQLALAQAVIRRVAGWWKRIRQSGRVERSRELADACAWANGALAALGAEKSHVRDEFGNVEAAWFSVPGEPQRSPREVYYHSLAARYCNVAGWCVTALEAVIAGGLSILLLALAWPLGATLGIAVTILLAIGVKGMIAPLVVGRYSDRPKAGRDLALTLLAVAGPLALALMAVIFMVRGVAGGWAAALFPWATGALAVVLPVIAAALFVLAGLYGWSRRLKREYRALEEAERAACELRDHCIRAQQGEAPTTQVSLEPRTTTLTKVSAIFLLALFALPSLACTDLAQAAAGASSQASPTRVAPSLACGEIWMDETISVDQRDIPIAAQMLRAVLLAVSRRSKVGQWAIYAFGEEPWRDTAFHKVELPTWVPPACEPPTEAARLFTVHRDDSGCRGRLQAAESEHQQELESRIADLERALRGHRRRPANCTAIGDLLVRVGQAPGPLRVMIITDGLETCRKGGLPTVPPPPAATQVVLVLLGSTPNDELAPTLADQFASRKKELARAAPWLKVVAPWEVTVDLFDSAPSTDRPMQ